MNIVIENTNYTEQDLKSMFGDMNDNMGKIHFSYAKDLPNLLVEIGAYPSTSKARQAGRTGDIPKGYTHNFKANKIMRLFIFNPYDTKQKSDTI